VPAQEPTSGIKVIVNNTELGLESLLDVQVREDLTVPDTAVVRLRDPAGANVQTEFRVGQTLEVRLAARKETAVTTVFKGEIVALEPEFTESHCLVAARAYDFGWRLNRQRTSRTFQNQTAEDMVRTVTRAAGLTSGEVEATSVTHPFFQQSMETDWEFCWRLARMYGYEFNVDANKRYSFRSREKRAPVATLKWGEDLLTFRPRMSGLGQVSGVTVANHDPASGRQVTAQARTPDLAAGSAAAEGRHGVVGALGAGSVVVADRVVTDQSDATKVAQATLDNLSSQFVEADGRARGNPKLRAGATVKVDAVGQFSGDYVLAQAVHSYRGSQGYFTTFAISGRDARSIADLVNRNGHRDWAASLVIGIVTNNNDPDGLGRVRVKFPALGSTIEGWWARVATINAGAERGMYMLPQPGDEVVVAFEHGDTRRPIVIGSLYNGSAKVPAALKDAQGRKALFGVKTDHQVLVDGKQSMTLRTGEKLTIEVNRDGQGGTGDTLLDAKGNIEQKAAMGYKVSAGQSIELTANQSVTIKGTGSVTVEATGPLKLKGATVDVEATGPVNVKGAIINLG
jgi:uncharacterized protein involved in type VI secretion and phage assembly